MKTTTDLNSPTYKSGVDPFDNLLGYQLRRLSVLVMTDLTEALVPLGLKPAEASIIYVIAANSGLTQSDIGRSLGIKRANMAPLIAGLMKRELLEREPVDGRSQSLRLSAIGHATYQKAWQLTKQHEERLFGGLSPRARARMITQLRGLWQNIDRNNRDEVS